MGTLAAGCAGGPSDGARDDTSSSEPSRGVRVDVAREVATALKERWTAETGSWNRAVVFHPDGDVVALSAGRAVVLARDTGAVLEESRVCSVVNDGAFVLADGRLALICETGVDLLRLPGGEVETVVSSGEKVTAGHVAAETVAVGSDGRVRLYDARDWRLLETFEVAAEVNDVAVSPDGTRVAVATEADLQLFERGGAGRTLHDERSRAVTFSSDGSTIFGAAKGFTGLTIDVASGAKQATMKTGSWISAARFADRGLIVATGSNGLELYGPGGGKAVRLDDNTAVGVAVEPGRACAGDRNGAVRCLSIEPLAPSSYVPAVAANDPDRTPSGEAEASAGDGSFSMSVSNFSASSGGDSEEADPENVHAGTLTSVKGRELVQTGSGDVPPVGTVGLLSKQVDKQLGTAKLQVWLAIAQVEVIQASEDRLTLRVIEERSVVEVNGQKTNHFTKGSTTRLAW